MSKSVLIIEKPNSCEECPFLDDCSYTCTAFEKMKRTYTYEVPENGVLENCPLKDLPQKKEPSEFPISPGLPWKETPYEKGWNACLDAIMKGGVK